MENSRESQSSGLTEEELKAQDAAQLPDREAMTLIDTSSTGGGLIPMGTPDGGGGLMGYPTDTGQTTGGPTSGNPGPTSDQATQLAQQAPSAAGNQSGPVYVSDQSQSLDIHQQESATASPS